MLRKIVFVVLMISAVCFGARRWSVGELFSSHDCSACRAANTYLTTNAAVWEDSAIVVKFHLDDGLAIDGARDRYNLYGDFYPMGYIPHMFINGANDSSLVYSWLPHMHDGAVARTYLAIDPVLHTFDSVGFDIYLDEDLAIDTGITVDTFSLVAVLTRMNVNYDEEAGAEPHTDSEIYNWVTSAFYTEPLGEQMVIAIGETLHLRYRYTLEPGWNLNNCRFVVYAVKPSIPLIVNGYEQLLFRRVDYDYSISTYSRKKLAQVGATVSVPFMFKNTGWVDDNYTVSLVNISIPPTWTVQFTGGGTTIENILEPMDSINAAISVTAATAGIARFAVVMHTEELSTRYDTLYFQVGAGVDNLIVNDASRGDSTKYTAFFDTLDQKSFYWDMRKDKELGTFSTMGIRRIFWFCGKNDSTCLTPTNRAQLGNYITSTGGNLFLSGSRIGTVASSDAGFYRISLGATFNRAVTSVTSVSGLDASSDFLGSTWYFGSTTFESVQGNSFGGITAFEYEDGQPAGIIKVSGSSHTVYAAFAIEDMSTNTEFTDFLYRAYRAIGGSANIKESTHASAPEQITITAFPNPFNASCEISYCIDGEGVIEIFDVAGKQIFAQSIANSGSIVWSPKTNHSGVYFAKINSEKASFSEKLLFVK